MARNSLENGKKNTEVEQSEKAFAADAKKWIEVIAVEKLLFDDELRGSKAL